MKNKQTTETKDNKKSNISLLVLLSYFAVCIGGLTLFVTMILSKVGVSWSFLPLLETIANAIAWAVAVLLSFRYIKNKRKIWTWVVWAVATVMIIVGIIL